MFARAGMVALCAVLAGCCTKEEPAAKPEPAALTVELGGCESVAKGPVCSPGDDRHVRLWVEAEPGSDVRIEVYDKESDPPSEPCAGGRLYRVTVPDKPGEVEVIASKGDRASSEAFRMADRETPAAVMRARALRAKGKLDEAEAALEPLAASREPAIRAQVARLMARIERARGKTDRAVDLLREAIDLERAAGQLSDEVQDRCVLAFTLLYGPRAFTEARKVLDGAGALGPSYPEGRVHVQYYRGLLAYETGDLRQALKLLGESQQGARRWDLRSHRHDVSQMQADLLATLGRHEEAGERMQEARRLLDEDAPACRRARLWNNMAWIAMRDPSAWRNEGRVQRIQTWLTKARTLFGGPCRMPAELANVHTNLAVAAWKQGAVDDLKKHLAEARSASSAPDPRVAVWWSTLEGHLALDEGDRSAALDHFGSLERIGAAASLPEAGLEGALGRATTLAAAGKVDEARDAFARADRLLERWSVEAPLGEGRESFMERHERTTRSRVAFLLRQAGNTSDPARRQALWSEAANAVRWSRARALRVLHTADRVQTLPPARRQAWEGALSAYRKQRAALAEQAANDWRRPADELEEAMEQRKEAQRVLRSALDEALARLTPNTRDRGDESLPSPDAGTLLIVYYPAESGCVAWTTLDGETNAHDLGPVDPEAPAEALGKVLIEPLSERIRGAKRIRFCPYGPLQHVDLHALPLQGKPVVEHLPVVYGIDLRPRSDAAAQDDGFALVVGDPRGDLAAARKEAETVAKALGDAGWKVRTLTGANASHDALRDILASPEIRLFHYAGHGVFEGRDGWESGLPLSGDASLTVGDVLALPHAPPRVVLSGCETARTTAGTAVAGLGLGQAFIVSGSRQVVAAMRPVDDGLASAVATGLVNSDAGLGDLGGALAEVQQKIRREDASRDWSAFRVLVR